MISWLRRWGWVAGVVVIAIAVYMLTRGKTPPPIEAINTAVKAAKADYEAEVMAAELGKEKAIAKIEADNKEAIDALDDQEKKQAETLRKDPRKLARFLVRAGARKRS